jgi:hypothetical protein
MVSEESRHPHLIGRGQIGSWEKQHQMFGPRGLQFDRNFGECFVAQLGDFKTLYDRPKSSWKW